MNAAMLLLEVADEAMNSVEGTLCTEVVNNIMKRSFIKLQNIGTETTAKRLPVHPVIAVAITNKLGIEACQ
jgi:hypothetical protein